LGIIITVAGAHWGQQKVGLTEWWASRLIASNGGYGRARVDRRHQRRVHPFISLMWPAAYVLPSALCRWNGA